MKEKSVVREWIEAILIAVVLAFTIRAFVIQAFKIPSGSMKPTLKVGDHILVNKFIYGIAIPFTHKKILPFKKPQKGDIIVFICPVDRKKDYIKRVVGIEGDKLEIVDKKLYINGLLFDIPNAVNSDERIFPKNTQPRDNYGPMIIPEDSLFVMGDNRDESYDSRYWGLVHLKEVKGKAFIIYWSWDKFKQRPRWKRIGDFIY
ncbi:MAG: signal peptidase I [Thermodesulfobacteriota bacterium]|nr:signal peptidase I [Thermodesulfobacteriota bacterium]